MGNGKHMSSKSDAKRNAVEQLFEELKRGTESFRSSKAWTDFLSLQSKMPDYSYNNCILIGMQTNGKASLCMGYESWKKLGRHVKAGETALRIICPAPRKVFVEDTKKDKDGNPIYDANGDVIKEKKEQVLQGYKVGWTFDVSQTEGKPLPEICRRIEGNADCSQRLIEAILRLPIFSSISVSFEKISGGANGYFNPSEKRIVIREDLSPNHKIHTLLHEITHATLHLNETDKEDTPRRLKEIEAESTAFVVMKHMLEEFGEKLSSEDLESYSFGYINSWSSSEDLTEMQNAMRTIQKTSLSLINSLDRELYRMDMEEIKSCAYYVGDPEMENQLLYVVRGEQERNTYAYVVIDSDKNVTDRGTLTLTGEKAQRMDEASREILRQTGMESITYQIAESNRVNHPENMLRIAAITSARGHGNDSIGITSSQSHKEASAVRR